jgi:ABC-2 type transport system permease protein
MTAATMPGTTASSRGGPGLGQLARLGASLRWRLVGNRARRLGKRTRWFAYAMAALYAVGNVVGLASARGANAAAAERTLVLLVSSLAMGWVFGPILVGGVDETVDPTRLALLPLRPGQLFTVQLAAALSGAGPLAALVGLSVGATIGFAPVGPLGAVVPLAAIAAVLLVVGLARSVAGVLAIAQRSRAGRDLAVLTAALLAGTLFVVGQLASDLSARRAATLVDAIQWSPWGWPTRAIIAAADGRTRAALVWLLATSAAAVAFLWTWSRLTRVLLSNGERVARTGRRTRGPVLHGASRVFTAALARQWIYLRRSPNTRVALLFGIGFGVAFPVLQILQHGAEDSPAAAFGCLLAMLANIGAAGNLLGFDAGSLWLETLCGGPGRRHMVARSVIVAPNLLLPTWLSGVVVGIWTNQWTAVALVALVAIPVAVLVLAQGLVTSILAPWPLPDGDNPFGNRQGAEGRGARLAAVALGGLGSVLVGAAPLILTAWLARDRPWVWLVPVVATAAATAVYAGVVLWLGRRLRGREPELLEVLSPRAVN